MTKKHFIAIAKTIHSNLERSTPAGAYRLHTLALELCTEFYEFNPNFSRDTFLQAYGFATQENGN